MGPSKKIVLAIVIIPILVITFVLLFTQTGYKYTQEISTFFEDARVLQYTDYRTNLKTTFSSKKNLAGPYNNLSLRDVITDDGDEVKILRNKELFGLTLHWTADDITLLDNSSWKPPLIIERDPFLREKLPKVNKDEFGITFLLSEDSKLIQNFDWKDMNQLRSKLWDLNNNDEVESNDYVSKGWDLDSGYIIYTFNSKEKLKELQNAGLLREWRTIEGIDWSISVFIDFSGRS